MAAHDQEVDWLADPEATIEQALLSGTQARQAAQDVLPTLPRKDASRHYPATLQDALSLVHSREDAKKKQAANQAAKAKHKALSGAFPGTDGHFPGAVEGGGDAGAYWMYLEDYFRDVTQEDFHDILPLLLPPREDPAFAICPPGSGNAIPPASTSQALAKPKAKSPPPPPPPPPPPIATLPTPDGTGGLVQERRSSRLVIRLSRGTDLPRYTEDDSDLLEDGMGGEEDGPGASSGHLSAIQQQRMPILRAADGQPASQLWDAVEDRRLALLALQLTALKDAVAGFVDVVKPASGKRLAKSVLQVATRAAGGGKARLSNDVRSQLIAWLEETAAVLTETLGCRVQLPILGLRRDIGAESREPGPSRPAGRSLKPANGTGAQSQHAVDNEVEVLNEARSAGDTTHDKNGNGNGNDNGAAIETGTTVETKAEHDAGIAAVGGPHSPPRPNPEQRPWSPAEAEEAHAPPQPSILSLPSSSQVHPYMRLLLRAPVPRHVRTAAVEGPFVDPALVAVLGRTPSVANLAPADGGEPPTGISNAATPTTSGVSEGDRPVSGLVVGSHARPRRALTPATCMGGGGAAQHGVSVPRKDAGGTYGRRPAQHQQGVASGAAGGQPTLLQQHPVAQAVAMAVAEGAADGSGEGQFSLATSDPGVLAAAPQDEIAAETLAVQAELAAVSAANRARLSVALQRLLEDLPRQRAAAATRAKEEADVKAWIMEAREATEKELRQRREAAHREALAAVGPGGLGAPRPVLGGGSVPVGEGGRVVAPYLGPEDMYDVLAQRREDEESFCAVCGDGSSMEPNVIVFCDRCDVAVHQHCYDVAEVPESEWLCWPCKEYEDMLRAQGVPQATIRPPGALPEDRRRLPGGSREVKCALCPIKCGAFRRTVDGQQWVHTACALWHLDSKIHATWRREGPNAIDGLSKILPKRWTEACDICGKVDGAVINCKHPGGCQFKFHVLCARNTGLYLTVRSDQQGRPSYRIYCAVHSRQQQEKDARAAMARMEAQDRVYERMVREENRRLALEGLAAMEEEQSLLNMLRINLEQCRVLLDQCKRREKLKRQAAMIAKDAHQERLQDPAAALAHLQKIDEMRNGGMGPAEQLVALGMSPGNAAALAAEGGAMHHQIQTMEQQPNMFALGVQARLPFTSPDTASDALQMSGASDASLMVTGMTASGRPRRAAVAKRHFQSEPAASPHVGGAAAAATLGGLMPSESKRPRRGVSNTVQAVASTQAPANSGATALQALPASADLLLIQRQQMMSTAEAEALNSRLPPGVKYVLLEQLPASLSHVEAGTDAPATVGRPSRTGTRSNPSSAAPSTLVQQQQQPSKGENAATRASARLRQTRS